MFIKGSVNADYFVPSWVEKAQTDFGFWGGSLTVDTDPPVADPVTTPDPVAPVDPPTTPEPAKPDTTMADVLAALKEVTGYLKPKPEPTPDPATPEPPQAKDKPTDEKDPRDTQIEAMQEVLRGMMIETYQVPDFLVDMLPADPVAAKAFLQSDKYKTLKDKLALVTKPLNTETTPTPEPTTPDPARKDPVKGTKKTFDEIDSAYLADLLKDVL